MSTARPAAKRTPAKRAAAPAPDDLGPRPISEPQMRHLHGLLRTKVGITDRDDVHEYLTVALGRPVESRTSLTYDEAEELFARLDPLPDAAVATTDPRWAALRAPFPEEAVGKLPRSTCRDCSQSQRKRCDRHQWVAACPECHQSHSSATMHIDFVGHADVTARLLAVDPLWTWESMGRDQFGNPAYDKDGNLWITMTVLGHTRPGVGDAGNGKGAKERIGDALRNAAMRFGVALDLWAKGDREWAKAQQDDIDPAMDPPDPWQVTPTTYDGPDAAELVGHLEALAVDAGTDLPTLTAKFRERNGGLTVEDLYAVDPRALVTLRDSIVAYLNTPQPAAGVEPGH